MFISPTPRKSRLSVRVSISRSGSCSQLIGAGVSNVSVAFLEELLKVATVIPAVDQIERHP